MTLFLALLLVHFIGDFYTQKQSWIDCKIKHKHRSIGLFKHICVHLLLTTLVLFLVADAEVMTSILAITIIVGTHYLIDIWKTHQSFTMFSFLADQSAHIVVLVSVSLWMSGLTHTQIQHDVSTLFHIDYLIIIALYMFALKPVSLIMFLFLRPYTQQLIESKDASEGLDNAGEYIGYLERGLIVTFLLLGSYASVGFLLTAKSVFRFGDMRRESDRKLTEYIMLGTLTSFGFAIISTELVKYLFL